MLLFRYDVSSVVQCSGTMLIVGLFSRQKIACCIYWCCLSTKTGYMNSPSWEGNTQQLWANINSVYISSHPVFCLQYHFHNTPVPRTSDLLRSFVSVCQWERECLSWWNNWYFLIWDETNPASPCPPVCGWNSGSEGQLSRLAAVNTFVCVGRKRTSFLLSMQYKPHNLLLIKLKH